MFLPFDAPLMDDPPFRLVYTLRCSVFGAVPVVLGEYGWEGLKMGRSSGQSYLSHLFRLACTRGLAAPLGCISASV